MITLRLSYLGCARVALVSDTHGNVTDAITGQLADAELVVHAGDIGNAKVLDTLASVASVVAVVGNNDTAAKWPAADRRRLQELPDVLELDLAGGRLIVVHGHQWRHASSRHLRLRSQWPDARCIVYGHSHRRVIDRRCEPWVANPGAAGRARAHGGAGWLGLTICDGNWSLRENGFA